MHCTAHPAASSESAFLISWLLSAQLRTQKTTYYRVQNKQQLLSFDSRCSGHQIIGQAPLLAAVAGRLPGAHGFHFLSSQILRNAHLCPFTCWGAWEGSSLHLKHGQMAYRVDRESLGLACSIKCSQVAFPYMNVTGILPSPQTPSPVPSSLQYPLSPIHFSLLFSPVLWTLRSLSKLHAELETRAAWSPRPCHPHTITRSEWVRRVFASLVFHRPVSPLSAQQKEDNNQAVPLLAGIWPGSTLLSVLSPAAL